MLSRRGLLKRGAAGLSMGAMAVPLKAAAGKAAVPQLVDKNATPETRALFLNLKKLARDKILFGHQDTTAYGVGWKRDANRSDVKDVTGSYPAVYGWEVGDRGSSSNASRIVDAFERGGVNTLSWHMKNPVTGRTSKDVSVKAVGQVLPGRKHHQRLKEQLDGCAKLLKGLKDSQGRLVPVVFRPWHEHTGGWFWWGQNTCTEQEFIALWRFTVTYLRDHHKIHNLLYAYSPTLGGRNSLRNYEAKRFPGYAFMDILGCDVYSTNEPASIQRVVTACRSVVTLADRQGKVPALTECGYVEGLHNSKRHDWYTASFLNPLKADPVARRIAWVMVWRNERKGHFWVPYPGHPAVKDFKKFYADPITVFQNDLPKMYSL